MFIFPDRRPLIFGHRGAPQEGPENTLPGFERALELGADGIELDVQLSADNELVVFHDEELSRTSNGRGFVRELRMSELRELDAGNYFSPKFTGTRISTLSEVFENFGSRSLFNLEIKPIVPIRRTVQLAVDVIRKHYLEARVIVSSFNPLILRLVGKVAPELYRGFLYDETTPAVCRSELIPKVLIGKYQGQHPQYALVDSRFVRQAHQRSYHVNVWTVNERPDIERMIDAGVDLIITDVPGTARTVLNDYR